MRAFDGETEGPPGGSASPGRADLHLDDELPQRGLGGTLEVERALQRHRQRCLTYQDGPSHLALERTGIPETLLRQLRTPTPPASPYEGDPELVVAADPYGASAEHFRELRIQLAAKALNRKTKAALAVISPGRREGRTYVAANLAASFAQLGSPTLLIDADLRAPRLHRLLGKHGTTGLADILRGEGSPSLLQPVPQVPALCFLPAGAPVRNPVELLQGPRFNLLLLEMLMAFDHVVLDTPADGWGPDARLVAARAGAALVVGCKGRSSMDALSTLVTRSVQQQTEIAGVVINQHRGR